MCMRGACTAHASCSARRAAPSALPSAAQCPAPVSCPVPCPRPPLQPSGLLALPGSDPRWPHQRLRGQAHGRHGRRSGLRHGGPRVPRVEAGRGHGRGAACMPACPHDCMAALTRPPRVMCRCTVPHVHCTRSRMCTARAAACACALSAAAMCSCNVQLQCVLPVCCLCAAAVHEHCMSATGAAAAARLSRRDVG